MDYTGFLKHYYTSLINKLNQYSSYNGRIVMLNYGVPVQKENLFSNQKDGFDGMPSILLNINSSSQDFENYLEYYGTMMPDLSLLFCSKNVLRELYNNIILKSMEPEASIDVYIDIGIDVLKQKGVVK